MLYCVAQSNTQERNATKEGERMLNVNKVRGRLAELRLTQRDVAETLGIAQATASQKLNRVRPMDLDEAEKLAVLLKIDNAQFGDYFFAQ